MMIVSNLKDVPPQFRPPRMWPTALLAAVTVLVSLYAAQSSYRASQKVDVVEQRSEDSLAIRCEVFGARLRIEPETAMERYSKALAKDTYERDCH